MEVFRLRTLVWILTPSRGKRIRKGILGNFWEVQEFAEALRKSDSLCQRNPFVHKPFCPQNMGLQPPPCEHGQIGGNCGNLSKASPRVVLRSCLMMYNDDSWLYDMMTSDVR